MPTTNEEINQSIIDNMNETDDTSILTETIPTSDTDIITVNDITLELEQLNKTLEQISSVQPLNEMILNRLELLLFSTFIIIALLIFSLLRRTPK